MTDLKLDFDEGIILQTEDVWSYDGNKEHNYDEMYLTNKNLIRVYEKSNGLFAKSETIVDRIPLSNIKVINGVVQAKQVKDSDYGNCLRILYTNGAMELYELCSSPKKEHPLWESAIAQAIVGMSSEVDLTRQEPVHIPVSNAQPVQREEKKKGLFEGLASSLNVDLQAVVEKAQTKIAEFPQQVAEKTQVFVETKNNINAEKETITEMPPIPTSQTNGVAFCSNCGTKLNVDAKFCHGCGSAVSSNSQPVQQPLVQSTTVDHTVRKQEYAGKVIKCPNCGGVITETTVICPECGMQLTGRAAVSSVQVFKDQLMDIENARKSGSGGMLGVYLPADKADIQKLTLIRNFPIPNSIDDILEFMFLAIANIDVNLSKNTLTNKMNSSAQIETKATIGRTISNAWVSKMEQCYKKAELLFPNASEFETVQRVYRDKMKELKIKVK